MLITDSRGIVDALTRHGPPQLMLRSASADEGLSAARQRLRAPGAAARRVSGLAQLAVSLAKFGCAARAPFWQCVRNGVRWPCKYDEKFESAKKRLKRNAGVRKLGDGDDETTAELQSFLQGEGASHEVKDLLRQKYSTCLQDRMENNSKASGFTNPV